MGFVDFATRIACFDSNLAVVKKNLITEMPYVTVAFFATVMIDIVITNCDLIVQEHIFQNRT